MSELQETTRQKKVSRLIQKELSEMFLLLAKKEIPGTLISVSMVRISPDLSIARVYLSIFPTDKTESILDIIEEKKWSIRHELAAKVRFQLRKVPDLYFYADDTLDYLENIDKLLKGE